MSGEWLAPLRRLRSDYRRYRLAASSSGFLAVAGIWLFHRGFHFVLLRRIAEFIYPVPLIGRFLRKLLWYWSCIVYGSEIAIGAEIEGGLFVPHPNCIVIGRAAIGANVTILQGVTIGQRSPSDPRNPTIEDGVTVREGAVVIGDVTIPCASTVLPRAVVTARN